MDVAFDLTGNMLRTKPSVGPRGHDNSRCVTREHGRADDCGWCWNVANVLLIWLGVAHVFAMMVPKKGHKEPNIWFC